MANASLASQWLDANDPKRAAKKKYQTDRRIIAKKRRQADFIAYNEWDEAALAQKPRDEQEVRRLVRKRQADSISDAQRQFMDRFRKFDKPQCLLLPFADGPATITFGALGPEFAHRKMATWTIGPPSAGQVCRHLCGNGHMGCVNPRHLAWGSDSDNSSDYRLHTHRPQVWPDVSEEERAFMMESDMPHNVVAVQLQIPATIVEMVRKKEGYRASV